MASALEARLQYLETREEANTKDIVRLKTENAELHTKVCELHTTVSALKRENLQANERFVKVESMLLKMETDIKTVFSFRESIESRLASLESNMTVIKDTEDRMNSLETVMNRLRQEVASCKQSVSDNRDSAASRRDASHDMVVDTLQKVQNDVKISHENVEKRLKKVETDVIKTGQNSTRTCQSVTDKMKQMEKRVMDRVQKDEVEAKSSPVNTEKRLEVDGFGAGQEGAGTNHSVFDRIKLLERESQDTQKTVRDLVEVRDAIYRSVTYVSLLPKHKPKTNETVKLVRCEDTFINGGYFNESSCCFEPPVSGYYGIGFRFYQTGVGNISFYYKTSRHDGLPFVGATFRDDDVVSDTIVVQLDKGDKLWLEMERDEGNADLNWCEFVAWLVSPL